MCNFIYSKFTKRSKTSVYGYFVQWRRERGGHQPDCAARSDTAHCQGVQAQVRLSIIHSFIHSFIRTQLTARGFKLRSDYPLFIHSFIRTQLTARGFKLRSDYPVFIHSFIHPSIHSFIHSFIHLNTSHCQGVQAQVRLSSVRSFEHISLPGGSSSGQSIHSFIHSLILSQLTTKGCKLSSVHAFIHPFIHFFHSFIII